ncbi:tRNA 2-thiouridine(34) synthase MnmA [Candidatus Deianiraea vastatrix]|uniref:tRNA-specific 2-thiouridylase MnmA n=1 Tax=Candidatus Deianiraea vastatrix TaxID=2163644 RepID=A0A5B8XEW5_9RICK|nr:tRNA 2-thiouridine(34) synthase MnmA [Candidatus Deianiraea vastatrix]QED23790.1 tRNA-specific 2-thiouridylase MnmA [Candidatus Deianiraea vastatrix]
MKSVMVGMSGGVDSSTVAAILHSEGWNVIGVTLQLYKQEQIIGKSKTCCGSKDIYDAKTVCSNLGIPHYVINYESTFKQDVIDDFIQSYKTGKTPIPCVKCNQTVKFRDMLKVACDLGIDYIATGHYVKRVDIDGQVQMHKAKYLPKDQSYFLFGTKYEQLEKTLFPLGDFTKDETRKIAESLGVKISQKPESQDICFIPDGDYGKFLVKNDPSFEKDGDIVMLETGEVVGKHNGAAFFTQGQRRGIGVGGFDAPLYVIKTDIAKNIVYIGKEELLYSSEFEISGLNFLSKEHASMSEFECSVIVRALKPEVKAKVFRILDDKMLVKLKTPTRAITSGQACVFYDETRVLGGGFII